MGLKRHIMLVLAAIYLVGMVGLAFNLHFCSGKLSTVSINAPAKVCKMCAKLAKEDIDDGCCKTASIEVKVKDDHQGSFMASILKAIPEFYLPKWVVAIPEPVVTASLTTEYITKAPPGINGNAIHIINCTYRI